MFTIHGFHIILVAINYPFIPLDCLKTVKKKSCQKPCYCRWCKPKVAIDYTTLFVRMVKKYNKHHKDKPLPYITPHMLRHTFCTWLASENMNPKDLQYFMGNSNMSITMNWYAHASIDTAKSEVQRLIA